MPLMVEVRDNLWCPTIICDACGKPITDPTMALYAFQMVNGEQGERSLIYFVHKGRCDEACERAHRGDAMLWGTIELADLPEYLAQNAGLAIEDGDIMAGGDLRSES